MCRFIHICKVVIFPTLQALRPFILWISYNDYAEVPSTHGSFFFAFAYTFRWLDSDTDRTFFLNWWGGVSARVVTWDRVNFTFHCSQLVWCWLYWCVWMICTALFKVNPLLLLYDISGAFSELMPNTSWSLILSSG